MRRQIELSNDVAAELAGPGDAVIKTLEDRLGASVFLRGNVLTLEGDDVDVDLAENVVDEVADLVRQGLEIAPGTIEAISGALEQHESPRGILEDVVWSHRGLRVAPKTLNQKRYLDAIRNNTITVGIGPAGTGKSFLAVAMAVAALSRREVNRIVLTRSAVEAGERLGFNSKMVVTGDITQIDLERDQRSGLLVVSEILEQVDDIEFVRLQPEDVVRHKLVQRIVAAYSEYAERQVPQLRRKTR